MKRGRLEIEAGRELTASEKSIADMLVDEGYYVIAKRAIEIERIRSADFEVDGSPTELKTISNITSPDIAGALARRILEGAGQAPHILVDTRKQVGMMQEIAENAVKRAFVKQTKDENVRIIRVRIIGQSFDVTIDYNPHAKGE